jgi:CheY-like chemotaxis protein
MKGRLILLVEDNPDDEALILRALRKVDLANEVVVAHDGVEALDCLLGTGVYARRGPVKPVLTLLDLKLPKVDGLQVLECIRGDDRTKRLPVVILTSSGEQNDILRSYELGVNSYVCKPIEFDGLLQAIAQLGLYWLLLNKPPPDGR